jgi:hypothetical protein
MPHHLISPPRRSRFVIEFAYNGLGYFAFAGKDGQDLDKAFPQYRDDFFWVSHTWYAPPFFGDYYDDVTN